MCENEEQCPNKKYQLNETQHSTDCNKFTNLYTFMIQENGMRSVVE